MARSISPSHRKVRENFARRLKIAREDAGFRSAEDLAKALGMKEAETYRRWERAETEPNLGMLVQIAEKLRVTLDWLIAGHFTVAREEKGEIHVLRASAAAGEPTIVPQKRRRH